MPQSCPNRRGSRNTRLRRNAAAILAVTALAALTACGGGAGSPSTESGTASQGSSEAAPNTDPVTLNVAWWGDTSRADRYQEALDLYTSENPHVTITTQFSAWGDYWSSRNTEAAGGALPDVFQMDLAYLTEYAQNGRLASLDDVIGAEIDVTTLPETLLPAGQFGGVTYAIPTSSSTLATFYNTDVLTALGLEQPAADLTWDEYDEFLSQVSAAGANASPQVFGSTGYTQLLWLFAIWLEQHDKVLFTEDGELGFDKEDLNQWWSRSVPLYEDGTFIPTARVVQLEGIDAFGARETAAEVSWNNFLVRFSEGTGGSTLAMAPVPADDAGNRGLFLKPGLMLSTGANSKHPEQAADLINFITNDPRVGEIFGMSRGVPASSSALGGFEPEGLDAEIVAFQESIAQDTVNTAPPSVRGFGTMEAAFTTIAQELSYGTMSVDQAVDEFFVEAETSLG